LIINELVSNSLKYAFPNGVKGEIFIELHSNNNDLTLIIGDNGKGLKIKDNNLDNYETLGFVLVKAQIRQLNGSCEIDSKDGTKFTIKFKMSI
jgi:two-component sensor histidine kinase